MIKKASTILNTGWNRRISLVLAFLLVFNSIYMGATSWKFRYAHAASGDVILLWDTANGPVPAGWTSISSNPGDAFYGAFPRAAATYGAATAGSDTHTHTLANTAATAPTTVTTGSTGGTIPSTTHTHTWGAPTVSTVDHKPPFKNLVFIRASSPTTIPANVIGIFDNASLPSGWTRYTALDGRYLRGFSDNATGGATTHNHDTGAVTSGAPSGTATRTNTAGTAVGGASHTHTIGAATNKFTADNNDPPHVDAIFAYNSSGGAVSIPEGLIALFDATPVGAWSIVSNAAPYTNNLLMGSATFGTMGGTATFSHTGSTTVTPGVPSTTVAAGTGSSASSGTHTHGPVTYSVTAVSSMPVYRDVILAKYGQTVNVGDGTDQANYNVYRGDTNKVADSFTLTAASASFANATVTSITVSVTNSANVSAIRLYKDNGVIGTYEIGTDTFLTLGVPGATVTFSGLSEIIGTTPSNYLIVVDVAAGATATQTVDITVTGLTSSAATGTISDAANPTRLTVASQTLTYGNGAAEPGAKTVYRGETNKAFDTFTLSVNGGAATVSQIVLTGTAGGGATNAAAVASGVKIWQDNGTTPNEWDAGDTLIGSTIFSTNTATFAVNIPVTTTPVSYIVTADIATNTTAAWTLTGQLSGMTSSANTNTDGDTGGATLTVGAAQTTTAGNGGTPSAKTVYRGETNKSLDSFTLGVNVGSTTVTQIVLTGTAGGGAANSAAVASAVDIWLDNGTTANEWDAGDTFIASTTFSANTATFSGLTIPVTTATANYIITADISPSAAASNTLTAQISAFTSYAQTNTDSDTGGATLTVGAAQTTTAGNGGTPSAKTVYRGETNKSLDSFTLGVNVGSTTVTQIVLTGTAGGGAANSAAVASAVDIWLDNGTTANEWDAGDTFIASTTFSANTATFSGLAIPVTTTAANYIITADIAPAAAAANTLTAQISAFTSYAQTNTDSDTAGSTLTVGSNTLTVGEGTNPVSRAVMQGSANEAVGAFRFSTNVGASDVSQIVITGTNPSFVKANGVKLWQDNPPLGVWDGTDVQVGSGVTFSGTTATFSGLAIQVDTAGKDYLVTYDIANKATPGQTTTGYISSLTSAANTVANNDNTIDATLTIKGSSTITSCDRCHEYPPLDSSTRNSPEGAVLGDHAKHFAVTNDCSTCHITPAANDYGHRNGLIEMQPNISGGSYNKGTSFAQVNNPVTSTCSNISCHGGNNPSPQWGVGTARCIDCHSGVVAAMKASALSGGLVTNRDNAVAEFGLAWGHKKSGRGAVADADCIVCHLEGDFTTQKTSSYHADGYIDLRDPDVQGETRITDISGNSFRFVNFSTSYAPGSRTSSGHLSNNIDNVLTQNFCLKCHDTDGALNTAARTTYGTPTAAMPFGGVALGANYTAANGAIGTQGLIDVKTQFGPTNSSNHPVRGPLTKDFPYSTRLAAPYNNIGTARDSNGTTGHTTALSVVLNCFDCHNVSGANPLTSRTVVAHGNAETIRGTVYVTSATFCITCHIAGYGGNTQQHGTGSAWAVTGSSHGTSVMNNCHYCHGSNTSTTAPVRPIRAQDYHGNNALVGGGLWPTVNSRPYAFIRGWSGTAYHRPYRATEFTTGSATCAAGTCPSGGQVGDGSTRTYTPGGTY